MKSNSNYPMKKLVLITFIVTGLCLALTPCLIPQSPKTSPYEYQRASRPLWHDAFFEGIAEDDFAQHIKLIPNIGEAGYNDVAPEAQTYLAKIDQMQAPPRGHFSNWLMSDDMGFSSLMMEYAPSSEESPSYPCQR